MKTLSIISAIFALLIICTFCYGDNSQNAQSQTQVQSQTIKTDNQQQAPSQVSNTPVVDKWKKLFDDKVASYKKENEEIKAKNDPNWKTQIVFFGDSITQGFDNKAAFPDKPTVNRGIVSDHIIWGNGMGLLNRYTPDVLAPNPSHIFILIGINDLGDGSKVDELVNDKYKKLLTLLRETYPSAKLITVSLLPTRDKYAKHNKNIVIYNEKLQNLAKEVNVKYIDIHKYYIDENGELKKEFTADGLHLKKDSYKYYADEIKKVLEEK